MADLRTTYLGLELASPLVASASPLTGDLSSLRALVEAGAAAVVLPSLFEEDLEPAPGGGTGLWPAGHRAGEAVSYLEPAEAGQADTHLELVRSAKRELDVPVIASLNGATAGGWTRFSELLQQAGADAIELNVYSVETDPHASGASIEDSLRRMVSSVRTVVSVPVAVKLSPFYTAFAHVARGLVDERADGLVLFNRFLQPNIDLETLDIEPDLHLSTSEELRLPLRWIALLHGRLDADLAATGGFGTAEDVVKALLVGANVVMLASCLIRNGPRYLEQLTDDLGHWLDGHDEPSVAGLRGRLDQIGCSNPRAFERAQYVRAVSGRGRA